MTDMIPEGSLEDSLFELISMPENLFNQRPLNTHLEQIGIDNTSERFNEIREEIIKARNTFHYLKSVDAKISKKDGWLTLLSHAKDIEDFVFALDNLLKDGYWDTQGRSGFFYNKTPTSISHTREILQDKTTSSLEKVHAVEYVMSQACLDESYFRSQEVSELYKKILEGSQRVLEEHDLDSKNSSKKTI